MFIWVDNDSCPRAVRGVIYKAAKRCQVRARFVANSFMEFKPRDFVDFVKVNMGKDLVDDYIFAHSNAADLVVTRDILFARRLLLERHCTVINDRGREFHKDSIEQIVADRNFNLGLYELGLKKSSEKNYTNKDLQAFAAVFDKNLQIGITNG